MRETIEAFLERERAQLPLWFAVGVGAGVAGWFVLASPVQWVGLLFVSLALALALRGAESRSGRAAALFGLAVAIGLSLVWVRSAMVASPRLDGFAIATFDAKVEKVEPRIARGDLRLTLAPDDPDLPPRVRVSMRADQADAGLAKGATVRIRARLTPPPAMALPGSHDFARDSWFRGIGAVGRALGPPTLLQPADPGGIQAIRDRLGAHVRDRLAGPAGTIASTLATGDQSAIAEEDAEAMRRSGLAHLLSVSGLHIAAVVGAAMLVTLRLLALSERLALRVNLVMVAAGAGALSGIAYTLLTGMQVPTVRSCIASLLVLLGIALGRDAISLRLVAVGALIVLLIRPEALAGASFQFSFAAVTAIIALHSSAWARQLFHRRDEGPLIRMGRAVLAMLATGLVVEIALMPFALYHFHKAGLYSVAANLVAIPLTTFAIMPLEAGALLLDLAGLGAPLWWLCGLAVDLLLLVAHGVANAKGAVTTIPSMPTWSFALLVTGFLWTCLWTTRARRWGLIPFLAGAAGAASAEPPDLMVTGDGRHLAVLTQDGRPLLLRDRSGGFIRSVMGEAAGTDGAPGNLSDDRIGRCSRDSCVATIDRGGRLWIVLATRSSLLIDWKALVAACAQSDIVVSERRLPSGCSPRWLKLDRTMLRETGGVAIDLDAARWDTVASRLGHHPWSDHLPAD